MSGPSGLPSAGKLQAVKAPRFSAGGPPCGRVGRRPLDCAAIPRTPRPGPGCGSAAKIDLGKRPRRGASLRHLL